MSTEIQALNLNDDGEGYVPIAPPTQAAPPPPTPPPPPPVQNGGTNNVSTAFVPNDTEKNIRLQQNNMMDSTPIHDVLGGDEMMPLEPPMMQQQPRMQGMMHEAPPQTQMAMGGMMMQPQQQAPPKVESKNPLNLTDDQLTALLVAACAAAAISKPVQDKLVTSVPKFLNEAGSRSMVGLATTGAVAAALFYIAKGYVVKN
jgi:hypothetical protein